MAKTKLTTVEEPFDTNEDVTKVGNVEVAASTTVTVVIEEPALAHVA